MWRLIIESRHILDYARGIPGHNRSWWNRPSHYGAGADHGVIPDCHPRQNNRLGANPDIAPDHHRLNHHSLLSSGSPTLIIAMLAAANRYMLGNQRIIPDTDRAVRCDYGKITDLHAPTQFNAPAPLVMTLAYCLNAQSLPVCMHPPLWQENNTPSSTSTGRPSMTDRLRQKRQNSHGRGLPAFHFMPDTLRNTSQ